MRNWRPALVFGVFCSCLPLSGAPPLVKIDFESGPGGWLALAGAGAVRITYEPADVKSGKAALAFDYPSGSGAVPVALPLEDRQLGAMKTIRFWMKTDIPTALAVIVSEKAPGGRYSAVVWSTGNQWQRVELDPRDFSLNGGPNDPPDPDGKLDLDRVQSISLVDVSVIFGAAQTKLPIAVDPHAGKHTLYLDDFEILPDAILPPREKGLIDAFSAPQLNWMTLGEVELRPENKGVRAKYSQLEDRYATLLRVFPPIDLRGRQKLALDIASDEPAQFVFSLEERSPGHSQGPRYNAIVDVAGGGKVAHREILFSAFQPSPDNPADPNGKLDLDQVESLLLIDITAATSGQTVKNSLWVGNLRAAEP